MTRRAALGGLGTGFLGTIVIGAGSGAILALVHDGFGAALVASVWGIVLAGILCALPAGVFAMFECWLLAIVLETVRANPSASKTAFTVLGTVSGPLMATTALLIYENDFEAWAWAVIVLMATVVGTRAGIVVWQIASTEHRRRWLVPVKGLPS